MIERETIDESNSSIRRPNSSRFPPIVSAKSATSVRDKHKPFVGRSISFDISHQSNQRPKSNTHYKVIRSDSISLKQLTNCFASKSMNGSPTSHAIIENNFDYENENKNSKISFLENEIETKCNELIKLKKEMTQIRPLSPFEDIVDYIDNDEEKDRLRKENEVLKQNFIKMSDIISEHNNQMSRKDNIILKLEEKYLVKNLDTFDKSFNSFYNNNNSKSHSNRPNNDSLQECLSDTIIGSEESHLITSELLQKLTAFIDKVISEFQTHLINFHKSIEEVKKIVRNKPKIENDLNVFGNKVDNNIRTLNEKSENEFEKLNYEYLELKTNYEDLLNEINCFKTNIDSLCGTKRSDNLSIDWKRFQNIYENLVEKNRRLTHESENTVKNEESILKLIEIVSEIELELELLGRNQMSLNYVITKFSSKFDSFCQNKDCVYMVSLTKILLLLYKNQLKWSQLLPNHSFNTLSESTDDEDNDSHPKVIVEKVEKETNLENESQNKFSQKFNINHTNDDISSDLLDKVLIDDIDIESINYILMSKSLNQNIYSHLEVVKEEEEDEEELNYEKDKEENETSEQLFFNQELDDELSNESMEIKSSSFNACEETELIVKQILCEIIDSIDKCLNEQKIRNNEKENLSIYKFVRSEENDTFVKNVETKVSAHDSIDESFESINETNELPFVRINVTANNNSQLNEEKLSDSAFASEDNCSSPEATHNIEKSDDSTQCKSDIKCTIFNNLKMDEKNLMVKLEELETQKELQTNELSIAKSRISQLERIMSDNNNYNCIKNNNNNNRQQSDNYLNDELKAWKELVEQQKAILEKVRTELENTQSLLREKDKLINILRSSNISNKVETQINDLINNDSVENEKFDENIINEIVFDSTNDLNEEEFGLNTLFDCLIDDRFEKINEFEEKGIDSKDKTLENDKNHNEITVNNERENSRQAQNIWNDSEDDCERIRSNASSKNSFNANNDLSDESSFSIESENISKSFKDEIFTKGFSKSYNAEDSRRRHSCQGRVVTYGNHPRKRKLELKNIEIVFNSKDKNKNKFLQ